MEIPKAPLASTIMPKDPCQTAMDKQLNSDHNYYSKLIEQTRIAERKWIGEWLHERARKGFAVYDADIDLLEQGKCPE